MRLAANNVPNPAVPKVTSNTSQKKQIVAEVKTDSRFNPWRKMKAFCTPIATTKDDMVINPFT
jgi:hypothetical protein